MVASATSLGQAAFEAYCVRYYGDWIVAAGRLPKFKDLKPEIQQAWEASAKTAADRKNEEA
jgi:hypothetical protein